MVKNIYTEINIHASAETVWKILTDFEKYPEWNPFIQKISGPLKIGSTLEVYIVPPDSKGMKFKPRILACEENKLLRWMGCLWFKGLFDGEHSFELATSADNSIRFIQSERFNGILVPLFARQLDTHTKKGFEAMNLQLKARAENMMNRPMST